MRMKMAGPQIVSDRRGSRTLTALMLVLAAGSVGCYRASGIQRASATANEIPSEGGDRVRGLKAAAGPGDFYVGNDFVELAVDGALFGDRPALDGLPSGGSIVDVGYIELDTSFHRVSIPSDALERLTPVVNLDPDLQIVFDRITPISDSGAGLRMEGGLLDPLHKVPGASWDGADRVVGVSVIHTVVLGKSDRRFTLTTELKNTGTGALGIRNLGDLLVQQGGGYRAVIPATTTLGGAPVANWGVDFPGTGFATPVASSVLAPMVAFMASEPGNPSGDNHLSLGLMNLDAAQVAVAADPQATLTQTRPDFVRRVAVGSLPVASLAAGQTLTYRRGLFLAGGASTSPATPAQATGLFNEMAAERGTLDKLDSGVLSYSTFGSAALNGPTPNEIRVERKTALGNWVLDRVEWREPLENLPTLYSNVGSQTLLLPTGTYRLTIRNAAQAYSPSGYHNVSNTSDRPYLAMPTILVEKNKAFVLRDSLAPEFNTVVSPSGSLIGNQFLSQAFTTRASDGNQYDFQPMRFTIKGQGASSDPDTKRHRGLGGSYNGILKGDVITGANYGTFQFQGGHGLFGAAFKPDAPGLVHVAPGSYRAYGSRGPLSRLESFTWDAVDGVARFPHEFIIFQAPLPAGWTSFDLPGPSQATTGGMLPVEQLASAMADHVEVVGRTEVDRHVDAQGLQAAFVAEFNTILASDLNRTPVSGRPLVLPARSSNLTGFGTATALWTPEANGGRAGGARPSGTWTLADFLAQTEGRYHVVHRPRGPQGLFTLKAFDPAVALGTGINAWWSATGTQSLGKAHGGFDALELLRAEGFNGAAPDPWFTEFKAVRADWFALLKQQTPTAFTKALGLSAGRFSQDTPVGHARTFLKVAAAPTQADQSAILTALRGGAAVASTGPLLDVTANGVAPGGLATATGGNVTLTIHLYAPSWVPVDEVRIVVNGAVVQTLNPATFTAGTDFRQRTATVNLSLATTKDAFIVVEAGVPLATTGAYAAGTPWHAIMKGMYPIAVTNPVFVDLNGGGYTAPGLP